MVCEPMFFPLQKKNFCGSFFDWFAKCANYVLFDEKQSSAKVKTAQLWGKSKDDLTKQLDELKTELGQLRVQKISQGASSKLNRMYVFSSSFTSRFSR